MTYGTTLPKTAAQKAQDPFLFRFTTKEWFERAESLRTEVVVEPASGSSITLPAQRGVRTVWQESGLSTIRGFEVQFSLVGQMYTPRRRDEVSGFLRAYPFLVPLLLEAHGKIAEYFGPSPETVLEVVTDPEAANHRELFILVRTSLTPSEALTRLERFDQEWWLDASEKARCMLNVDLEYV